MEKEGLALIFTIRKFHKMIYRRLFKLFTDHKPFFSIFVSKSVIPVCIDNRLQRWVIILLVYGLKMKYKCMTSSGQADAFSGINAKPKFANENVSRMSKILSSKERKY